MGSHDPKGSNKPDKKDAERLRKAKGALTDDFIAVQKELIVRLELLMEQEETIWIQRARANWLKHGDRRA